MRVSTRLLLIIAACLVPTLVLQVAVSWSQWAERKAQLDDLAVHQAELLAGTVDNIANSARILLGAAAELNPGPLPAEGCGRRLASLREHAAGFAFIALTSPDGVTCASDPALEWQRDGEWVRSAQRALSFTAGHFTRPEGYPGGVLPFYMRLADQPGQEGRVLVAALDLDWLEWQLRHLKRAGSPFMAGGVLTVSDDRGVILGRDVRHAEFVGKSFPPAAMEAMRATQPGTLRLRSIDGARRLVGYTPPTPANIHLSTMVGFDEAELMGDIERALLRGVLLLTGVTVIVFALTLLAARRFITRPTNALLAVARRWRSGDLSARAPGWDRRSEFGQLAAAWNAMACVLRQREEELRGYTDALEVRVAARTAELVHSNSRLQAEIAERQNTEAALLQAQKVQAVGQLAGGIAHDFNNVLQAVLGGVSLIRRRSGDPEAIGRLTGMVEDAARRGESVTRRLLAFSRREELRAGVLEIAVLLEGLQEVLSATLGSRIRVRVESAPGLPPVLVDRGQLETVLVNLATNARDAMPAGGALTLLADAQKVEGACEVKGLAPGHYVRITVMDTGEGMDAATLARAAEPFFTTKPLGQGTGLGLAMARSFAQGSGGALAIASAPGEGTRVSLWLPVTGGEAEADGAAPVHQGPALWDGSGPRHRVMLVDDDPIVRDVLVTQLADAGFAVEEFPDGEAALGRLGEAGRVDILVTDLAMPGMDGVALIREAQKARPGLPAILVTGYAGDAAALAVGAAVSGPFALMRKPVTGTQLADQVEALLGAAPGRAERMP
ncbi:response regulator [Muricoccus pecuniae]|uniref:histidine kinase n=1 Tax=Muricoccus pecuniae TaxID=693023 RepID=A0A840Y2D1_9PROT|nr:response regulator [Roseomonas pecuniae]MBB5694895.1 signal transduction histidine kinase/CheY-like chemotaxis protein [Roseomonas pecuniae]